MSTTSAANSTQTSSRLHKYDSQVPPDVGATSKSPRRTMATERASSISDSSPESAMADNETETCDRHQSERSPPQATAPPKKKRTRTLTTPHQSAALHALLEKSRFPTTAMREEVGRQIGLSARKVQIWFQNQRQKARRPQADSAPLARPPQFGPFPIITTNPGPSAPPSYSSPPSVTHSGPSSAARSSLRAPGDSNPALAGPGIPGWSHRGPPSTAAPMDDEWDKPLRIPMLTSPDLPPRPPCSPPPHAHSHYHQHRPEARKRGLAPKQPGQGLDAPLSPPFSRTLPPISAEPFVSASSPFSPQPRTTPFMDHHQRRDPSVRPVTANSPAGSPRSLFNIPPPFALQPKPQWDPHTFSPYTRPEFASWSHPSSSAPPRTSFTASSGALAHDRVPPRAASPSGRFYSSTSSSLSARSDRRVSPDSCSPSHPTVPPPPGGRGRQFDDQSGEDL